MHEASSVCQCTFSDNLNYWSQIPVHCSVIQHFHNRFIVLNVTIFTAAVAQQVHLDECMKQLLGQL